MCTVHHAYDFPWKNNTAQHILGNNVGVHSRFSVYEKCSALVSRELINFVYVTWETKFTYKTSQESSLGILFCNNNCFWSNFIW